MSLVRDLSLSASNQRAPALVAALVTASGLALAGIGSAFWGLVAEVVTLAILRAAGRRG
jgi:benzoate membrane transport protein